MNELEHLLMFLPLSPTVLGQAGRGPPWAEEPEMCGGFACMSRRSRRRGASPTRPPSAVISIYPRRRPCSLQSFAYGNCCRRARDWHK